MTPGWTARAFAGLVTVLVAGALLPFDPDFDVLFGFDTWRTAWAAALVAGAATALVVLHPRAADTVAAAVSAGVRRIPDALRVPLLAAAMLAAFVLAPDTSLSGDAGDIAFHAAARHVQPSNALTSWLHHAAAGWFGLDGVAAVRVVSWAAGVAGVVATIGLSRALFDDAPRRVAAAFLFLTTGSAALWFGSIEVYAPLGAAAIAYLWAAVRAVRRSASVAPPALVLGVAFAAHGVAGLLLPSLALLAWDGGDGGPRRVVRRLAGAAAAFLVPVAATFAGLWFGVWRGVAPGAGPQAWGNFLGAGGEGPVLPLLRDPGDVAPRYALVDAEHVLAAISTVFVAAPAAWALLAAAPRAPPGSRPERKLRRFAVVALLGFALLPFVWNVSYGLRRDWDLFSVAGAPAALVAAVVALREPGNRARAAQVAAVCVLVFVPFVAAHAGDRAQGRTFAQAAAYVVRNTRDPHGQAFSEAAARRWDRIAIRLDPAGIARLTSEADRLAAAGDLPGAVARLDEALAAEPDEAYTRQARGFALARLGRRDAARADFLRSLETRRENLRIPARHALGRMALEDGDLHEAVRQLERGLREDGEHARAAAMARDLAGAHRHLGHADVAAALERFAISRERR